MPVPVISPTILKNVFAVGESFVVQLGATNTPTEWNLANTDTLPAGVFFDTTNGTLFGSSSSAGCYKLHFTAENADGASDEVGFDFGFHNVRCDTHHRTALINLDTLAVTLGNPIGTGTTAVKGFAKYNDDLSWEVTLVSSQATCMPKPSMIQFALRSADGTQYLQSDVTAFAQETIFDGTGYVAKYYVYAPLNSDQLASDLEAEAEYIDVSGEFELVLPSNSSSGVSASIFTTETFTFRVYKEIVV
jgi:hypothetical protein